MSDTWPEIVKVLDAYSLEAWRSGMNQREQEVIRLLENEAFINGLGDVVVNEKLDILIALIKGEK